MGRFPPLVLRSTANLWQQCRQTAGVRHSSSRVKKGPMLEFQDKIPFHPVPRFQASMEKLLRGIRPLVSDKQMVISEKVVGEFRKPDGVGEQLHKYIENKAKTQESWIADWWLQCDYLDYRDPLVVFSSPSSTLGTRTFSSKDDQLRCAATIISAALKQKNKVDNHELEVDRLHGQPLDMNQYFKIFSSYRVPREGSDELVLYGEEPNPPRHIVVIHNNRFFKVDVYHPDGTTLSPNQIFTSLSRVVKMSPEAGEPLGLLTSENRDVWARAYNLLREDDLNRASLDQIQRSIFICSLDRAVPTMDPHPTTHALKVSFTAGGSQLNGGNRWYDKCIQFHVTEDGIMGLTVEHAPAEGYPAMRMIDTISEDLENYEKYDWSPAEPETSPVELKFNLSPGIKETIKRAGQNLDALIANTDVAMRKFDKFGKNFIKSQGLSPDSFIQIAMTYGFYKLHGPTSMYEVATARKFLHGRMEIIRGTSEDSIYLCDLMSDPSSSPQERLSALRAAVITHKLAATEATNGEGIECLLQGYKKAAKEMGLPQPDLFSDPGYIASSTFRVVSSQVELKSDAFGIFGPRDLDGYGFHYHSYPNYINPAACCLRDSRETDAGEYVDAVIDALDELMAVATSTRRRLKKTASLTRQSGMI